MFDHAAVELVSYILIGLIAVIAVWTNTAAFVRSRTALSHVRQARALFDDVTEDNLWARRGAISSAAEASSTEVRDAWREFDEALVSDDVARKLWNTTEAEHFFNERRFAPRLVDNRLLDVAPTVLTTLGLIGTFFGLWVGLTGIALDGTTEEMTQGIQVLVAGAGVGFRASLIGVAASLLTNAFLKYRERKVVQHVHDLQDHIDALFTLRSPEHSLSDIATSSEASASALAELHEKIGAQLQEAVAGVAESTREALTDSINGALLPVMEELSAKAASQSAEVFDHVARQLTSAFHEIGTTLSAELRESAQELRGTLTYMADKLAEQADQYREQMEELRTATTRQVELLDASLPRLIDGLDASSTRIGSATDRMDTAAQHLDATSQSFESVSQRFSDVLAYSTATFESITAKNADAADALKELSGTMVELGNTSVQATAGLRESADVLRDGFTVLRGHQEAFLADLETRLSRHADEMSTWLATHSDAVSKQTQRRMDEWNSQTEQFTSGMLTAVQALSSAIDELDATRPITSEVGAA